MKGAKKARMRSIRVHVGREGGEIIPLIRREKRGRKQGR